MDNLIIRNTRDLKENINILDQLDINNFNGNIKGLIDIIGLDKFKELCSEDLLLVNDILLDPRFNDLQIDSKSTDMFGELLLKLSNKGRFYNLHCDEYSKQTKEKYSYLFVDDKCPEELKNACIRKDKNKIWQMIKEKPEYIDFIKDVNLNHLLGELSFGEDLDFHSILSKKFGNEFYLKNILQYEEWFTGTYLEVGLGRNRKGLTDELSNESLVYLINICGEYAIDDEFIQYLKDNKLKNVDISQIKKIYIDYFEKTDKSFAKLDVLNKMGVQNEDTIRLNNEFLKLRKFRPKTQMNNPQLLGGLFNEEILENFGYETISKLLDFNTNASINLIEISSDKSQVELLKDFIAYLEENNSMNTKVLHYAINSFRDSQDLYKSIILGKSNNKINLENLEEILENGNEYSVTSIEELNNFTKRRMMKLKDEFESDNYEISQNALCKILFNKSYKDSILLIDKFSLDKLDVLQNKGVITEEQSRILNILNMVKNDTLNIDNIESLSTFIDENNINTTLNQIERQMKAKYCQQYNEVLFDEDRPDKSVIESELTTPNGKKVRILDLNNTDFNFIVHKIFSYSTDTAKYYSQLIHNPENWNGIDGGTSTISTSFISDLSYKVCGDENLEQQVILGFSNIPEKDFLLMGNDDIISSHGDRIINPKSKYDTDRYYSPKMMALMTKHQTGKAAGYNEITLDRNCAIPSYLIAYDGVINENTLRYAEYFNIPIINIDREKYANRNKQFISSVTKGKIDHFEIEDIERLMYYPTAKVSIQKKFELCENTLDRLLESRVYSREQIETLKNHLGRCVEEISLGLSVEGINISKQNDVREQSNETDILDSAIEATEETTRTGVIQTQVQNIRTIQQEKNEVTKNVHQL